jgi:hypothetical protein
MEGLRLGAWRVLVRRGPAWRSGLANTLHFLRRFSRTSRWKLTSSSLFAKRGCRLACFGTQHCALLIVPPIVSGATPTLEAPVFGARRAESQRRRRVRRYPTLRGMFPLGMASTTYADRQKGCVNVGSCTRELAPSPSVKARKPSRDRKRLLNRPREATFAVLRRETQPTVAT